MESLRLWPVVPEGSGRTVSSPPSMGPYEIPPGTEIMISNIGALRSKQWGVDSEIFSPECWLDNSEKPQELRKAFTGFSYAHRTCAGRTLAEQEAKIVLATIVRNFEFLPIHLPPIGEEMLYHVTARPRGGLSVQLRRRERERHQPRAHGF
ncbi:unnamed protein product [Durusdinium trenchii]|uniref:4-desaturase n=2 Tax=Durusdinium trenchii TaxID=1381693 RepID=A0ABP0QSB2_9DINO